MVKSIMMMIVMVLSCNAHANEQPVPPVPVDRHSGKKACAGAFVTYLSGGIANVAFKNMPQYGFTAGATSVIAAGAAVYTVNNMRKYCVARRVQE